MFYTLSEEQINKIKSKFYPQEIKEGEFIKSIIINDSGSDNILKIILNIKDGLEYDSQGTQIFKIFNNDRSKKYLKLKLFEIINQKMHETILNNTTSEIQQIQKIINDYAALSVDISPSHDFIGDKSSADKHIRNEKYNNCLELTYETSLTLNREKINFLSLGLIFYFDTEAYIKDSKVEEKYIDKRILTNKVLLYDLYRNNELINSSNTPVQDLRVVKSTFKESRLFDDLLSIINSDNSYYTVEKALAYNKNDNLESSNENEDTQIISNIKKEIAKSSRKKYFSNVYFSRNSNENLGFIFNLNYLSLLVENTAYGRLLGRSKIQKEFLDKCKISSIKIVRRRVNRTPDNKIIPKMYTLENVVTSGEQKNNSFINDSEETSGAITEIKLNSSNTKITRTFCITDKNVFFKNRDLYQYGVELNVSDSINYFLSELNKNLESKVSNLKEYLDETDKIARPYADQNGYQTLVGSYDPQKNGFTLEFIRKFDLPRNSSPSFQYYVADAASMFVSTLQLLGLIKTKKSYSDALIKNIVFMLHPRYTKAETILYFIKIFERLINQIKRIIKNNYNNQFTISNWFKNDLVDSRIPIKIGYKYIHPEEYKGIPSLNINKFIDRAIKEVNKFALNPDNDSVSYENKKISYLSPSVVYSKNKITAFDNLELDAKAISDLDFVELELDVKNTNILSFDHEIELNEKSNKKTNTENIKKNKISVKSSALSNAFSAQIKNIFKETSQKLLIVEKEKNVIDENVDSMFLSLSLAKQFNIEKNTYYRSIKSITDNVNKSELFYKFNESLINKISNPSPTEIDNRSASSTPRPPPGVPNIAISVDPLVPIHLNFLLNDTCKLLNKDENYRKSIKLNSKFLFLFNAIQAIEVLEYTNDYYEEKWSLLTREKLRTLNLNGFYLCRFKNYKSNDYGIEGMKQINMPIYDNYFLLFNNNIAQTVQIENFNSKKIESSSMINDQLKQINYMEVTPFNPPQPYSVALEQPVTPSTTQEGFNRNINIKNPFSRSVTNKNRGRTGC